MAAAAETPERIRARVRPGHRWEVKRGQYVGEGAEVQVTEGELRTCAHALISLDEERKQQEAEQAARSEVNRSDANALFEAMRTSFRTQFEQDKSARDLVKKQSR